MSTSYTLTGNVRDLVGDLVAHSAQAYLTSNLGDKALVDLDANRIRLSGTVRIQLAADGAFSESLIATNSTGTNIGDGSLRYRVTVAYKDASGNRQSWDSGYFELTGNLDLSDAVAMAYLEPTFTVNADDIVTGLIETPGSGVEAALTAEYAPGGTAGNLSTAQVDPRSGVRFIPAGDSLSTYLNGGTAVFNDAIPHWPVAAQAYTEGRLQSIRSGGVSGNLSWQLLARLDADIIAHAPSLVSVWIGTNDISGSIPDADFYANVTEIHDKLRDAHIDSVVVTIPPRTDATKHATIAKWNLWLKRFAAETNRPLWDFHGVLVNAADGTFKAGFSDDGIHATAAGHHALAQYVAARIDGLIVPGSPVRATHNTDPRTLVANGFLVTGAPANWTAVGNIASGFTETLLVDSDFAGKAFEWDWTTGDGFRQLQSDPITTEWAVGDLLRFHARIKVTAESGLDQGEGIALNVIFDGAPVGAVQTIVRGVQTPGANGFFFGDLLVPDGTTGIYFLAHAAANAGETFTARVGEFGVINLTDLP